MKAECASVGWIWDTQAPHMPHSNVLDLVVFPAMSKNHDSKRQYYAGMLRQDEIWENATAVWEELTSPNIAKAFLILDGVLDKVIAAKGEVKGVMRDLHNGVRQKYEERGYGMWPRQRKRKRNSGNSGGNSGGPPQAKRRK